jgi:asparaginyl-tRNA synthetase
MRQRPQGGFRRTPQGDLDYKDDFFSRAAFLTVSGQLQGEYYASALSNIYTFGPTFRRARKHAGAGASTVAVW